MPRHSLIEVLHEAWYDLLWSSAEKSQESLLAYEQALKRCCEELECSPAELKQVLRGDFSRWLAENSLPKPPAK